MSKWVDGLTFLYSREDHAGDENGKTATDGVGEPAGEEGAEEGTGGEDGGDEGLFPGVEGELVVAGGFTGGVAKVLLDVVHGEDTVDVARVVTEEDATESGEDASEV